MAWKNVGRALNKALALLLLIRIHALKRTRLLIHEEFGQGTPRAEEDCA
jgi:hypothetical protein